MNLYVTDLYAVAAFTLTIILLFVTAILTEIRMYRRLQDLTNSRGKLRDKLDSFTPGIYFTALIAAVIISAFTFIQIAYTLSEHGDMLHNDDGTASEIAKTIREENLGDEKLYFGENVRYGPKGKPFSARIEREVGPFTIWHDGTTSNYTESDGAFPSKKGKCQIQETKHGWVRICKVRDEVWSAQIMSKKKLIKYLEKKNG